MSQNTFEYLASFISGSFHQDYDIYGDTLDQIVAAFNARAMPKQQERTLADLREYLGQHPDDTELSADFYKRFDWDLIEDAFGKPRDFLTKVAELLSTPETQQRRAS